LTDNIKGSKGRRKEGKKGGRKERKKERKLHHGVTNYKVP